MFVQVRITSDRMVTVTDDPPHRIAVRRIDDIDTITIAHVRVVERDPDLVRVLAPVRDLDLAIVSRSDRRMTTESNAFPFRW